MIKKGLVTLVCLTVMSALWSWAATTYSISTKINSLGTKALYDDNNQFLRYTSVIGGTISVDNKAEQDRGVKYTNYTTTSRVVTVVVDPKPGYKISALTKNGTSVSVGANQTTPVPVEFVKPLVLKTQTLVATFAVESVGAVQSRTWQLQIQNQNGGGKLSVTRGVTPAVDYTSIGKPLVKNYLDTTPVSVLVDAADGYRIDYILVNGQKITILTPDAQIVPIDPKEGSRVRSVVAAYKKKPLAVTTDVIEPSTPNPGQIGYIPNGIAPINPNADVYGNVRLIVTPTGSNNIVDFITVAGRKVLVSDPTPAPGTVVINRVTLTDRFGDVATLPNRGAVKVTISGITSAITVTATYKKDNTLEMGSCTKTCHLQSSNAVVLAVPDTWKASAHYKNAVDCVTCHQTMPGTVIKATVSATSFLNLSSNSAGAEGASYCASCHNNTKPLSGAHAIAFAGSCSSCHTTVHNPDAVGCDSASCHAATAVVTDWAAGAHGTASGHNTGTCQRCHATEGAIVGATVGWTGSYTNVLKAYSSTVWRNNAPAASSNGISCAVCHDPHGGLRAINTYNGTAAVAWDPNQNSKNDDQFDVCTSCHTMQDNTGAQTDMYHEKSSISIGRMIGDSHYDNPATGLGSDNKALANGNVVEGYVIRTKSANPCADCHNLHSADLTIQEAWGTSAHAGKITSNKSAAILAACNAANPGKDCLVDTGLDSRNKVKTLLELFEASTAGVATAKAGGALDDHAGNGWTHYNWDLVSRADCQRCHTSTGLANFLDSKINKTTYVAADNNFGHLADWTAAGGSPQNELLYCWGCHNNSQTGELRNPGAIVETYAGTPTVAVTYPNVGKSNVCMACHLGRETGAVVAASTVNFSDTGFINSHYLAAGASIFNESGYEYAGQNYTMGAHRNVGAANGAGPCVACHMTSAEGHSFEIVAKDAAGVITAVETTTCASCHGTAMTAAKLEADKATFHTAMESLKTALANKGILFANAHPYFYKDLNGNGVMDAATEQVSTNAFKNWDAVAPGKGKDVMGAAFNYNLFEHDPGAYAHNRGYALNLIADSIDFLADGVVNGQGVFTINAVETNLLGTKTVRVSDTVLTAGTGVMGLLNAEVASTKCEGCHSATATEWKTTLHADANGSPSGGGGCATCHAPNGEYVMSTERVANGSTTERMAGVVGCAACHGEGHPVAGAAAATACASCHDYDGHHGQTTPSVAKRVALSKHNITPLGEIAGHNSTGCQRCHTLEGYVAFGESGNAFGGPTNGSFTGVTAVQNVSCAACHDPHTGTLRATPGWDVGSAQYDLCTSCHNLTNAAGTPIASGLPVGPAGSEVQTVEMQQHKKDWYRNIASTHYDLATTGPGTGATNIVEGYVVRKDLASACTDCHGHELRTNTGDLNTATPAEEDLTIHTEWAQSGHAGGLLKAKLAKSAELAYAKTTATSQAIMAAGSTGAAYAWGHYPWSQTSTRGDCQKCHTTTGYVNKIASQVNGTAYDFNANDFSHLKDWTPAAGSGQAELLYCWGCHSNAESGALRASGATTLDYTVGGQTVAIPNVGNSNACILCHAGRGNANDSNTSSRFAGHHGVAGATLFSSVTHVGYEFAGLSYANVGYFAHDKIGVTTDANGKVTGSGPCASCHMSGANHKFEVVEKNAEGVIVKLNATSCYSCHTGAHGAALVAEDVLGTDGVTVLHSAAAAAAFLEEEAEGYKQAADILVALAANTITNYKAAVVKETSTVADDRGAFQNSKLIGDEPGAFAHNRVYAKRLIFDSIDYLEDGYINGSIADYSATYPHGAAWLGSARP